MNLVLGFAHTTAVRLAEVAFLLIVIAGVWIASASLSRAETWHIAKFVVISPSKFRMTVAGILLAAAGVLLIVATRGGHLFG